MQGEANLSISLVIVFRLKCWRYCRLFNYILNNEDLGWVSVPENGHINTGVACSDEEMPNFNHSQRYSDVPPKVFHNAFQILRDCNYSTISQIQKWAVGNSILNSQPIFSWWCAGLLSFAIPMEVTSFSVTWLPDSTTQIIGRSLHVWFQTNI